MLTSEPKYTILLIDDDPDSVAAGKTVLEFRPNYKVLTANDAVFWSVSCRG